MIELTNLLQEVSRREEIQSDKEYKILGVRWYAKGLFIKDIKKGSEIQANYIYRVNKGDFIYSRLFAWKGSFAIATEEFDGCYVSNEFPCFLVKNDQLSIEYLMWYFNQPRVWDNCLENSEGSTAISRNRLKVDKFLDIRVPLPTLEIQEKVVSRLNDIYNGVTNIMELKEDSDKQVSHLRESILKQAIQGNLVPQDPTDEPASVLLERIKAEKEQLIKEKKIKKENPMPKIMEDEIPHKLPKGWEWVRFQDIGELERGKSKHRPRNDEILFNDGKYPLVQTGDVARSNGVIKTYSNLYNEVGLKQSRLWSKGTLCITIAANIADTGVLDFDACFPDSVVGFLPYKPIESMGYFYYFVKISKDMLNMYAPSTAQKNINLSILNDLLIPLPPLNEMQRIVGKVDQLMALCDELEKAVEQSRCDSEMLMQSLLKEAFSQSEKENNVVDFQAAKSNDFEDWEIAARSDGEIDSVTKVKIKNRVTELLGNSQQ